MVLFNLNNIIIHTPTIDWYFHCDTSCTVFIVRTLLIDYHPLYFFSSQFYFFNNITTVYVKHISLLVNHQISSTLSAHPWNKLKWVFHQIPLACHYSSRKTESSTHCQRGSVSDHLIGKWFKKLLHWNRSYSSGSNQSAKFDAIQSQSTIECPLSGGYLLWSAEDLGSCFVRIEAFWMWMSINHTWSDSNKLAVSIVKKARSLIIWSVDDLRSCFIGIEVFSMWLSIRLNLMPFRFCDCMIRLWKPAYIF